MGRNLNQIIGDLPLKHQARIDARYREIKDEIEGLPALRRIAGKAQADIAAALNIKQPSVSRIAKRADMYLSTLRSTTIHIDSAFRGNCRTNGVGDVFSYG
jgi:hypothetical protein